MFGLKTKKKARKLEDIEIEEISLVTKGSNRKRFAVVKMEQAEADELVELFKGAFGDDPLPESTLDKVKNLTPEAGKAIKEALTTLQGYNEVFDDKSREALKILLAWGLSGQKPEGDGYGYPEKNPVKDEAPEKKVDRNGDELKFYKEDGLSELDCEVHRLFVRAKEDRRRSGPHANDGYIFKAADEDDEPDESGNDDEESQQHGVSKALKGQDGDEEGDIEPVDNFPSFQFPVFPKSRRVTTSVL